MSPVGDDGYEMPRPGSFDDDAIDALLAGTSRTGDDAGLASFIADLRASAEAVPTPSPMLAAAIAAGGISTVQPPGAKWRKFGMQIKGFLAGLGVAGKLALGVGVAAAATTGAGAAGVLPGPVQHVMAKAVGDVTPFSMPDPAHHGSNDGMLAGGEPTTTTAVEADTTTSVPKESLDGTGDAHAGDGSGAIVTPTTVAEHHGDGNGDANRGNGDGNVTPTTHDGSGTNDGGGSKSDNGTTENHNGDGNGTTPTSVYHDGDNNNPESLSITCAPSATSISCTWTASANADHASYLLVRIGDDQSRVMMQSADALSFTDSSVKPGVEYQYRVDSLRADGSVDSHSALVSAQVSADTTTTTTGGFH